MKVLVVEDNVSNQRLLETIVERNGWKVITAETGMAAYSKYIEQNPDIILLDISIPDMDGYEVTKKIREYELNRGQLSCPKIPIIAVSGHTSDEYFARALDAGVNECLPKPIDMKKLVSSIKNLTAKVK